MVGTSTSELATLATLINLKASHQVNYDYLQLSNTVFMSNAAARNITLTWLTAAMSAAAGLVNYNYKKLTPPDGGLGLQINRAWCDIEHEFRSYSYLMMQQSRSARISRTI